MKIDLGSFAFGSSVKSGGNTPSWGTSLGQVKPELKLTYPGYDNIVIGMVYKSIPVNKVYIPLGKGGHVCNSLEDEGIQLAAMFDKVYINEVKINAPFIMLIYKEDSDSWRGRKTLKYSTKIEYRRGNNDIVYNSDFVSAAKEALQIAEDACWLISDIYIVNQDELHMIAGIVNPYQSVTYSTTELRKADFINAIKTTYDKNPHFRRLSGADNYNDGEQSKSPQQIFYGAPGTGKSHTIKDATVSAEDEKRVYRTTFHPDSDYSTFVGCYKPSMKPTGVTLASGEKEEVITYKYVPQAFTNAYVKAWNTEEEVFLIIEEINRGNCAQIFGDLFQLLDRNDNGFSEYSIDADSDLADYLAEELKDSGRDDIPEDVQNGTKLQLPSNLIIWATMNTSDQSLFPIDSAFKRRWDWTYIPIVESEEDEFLVKVGDKYYDWWTFVSKMNGIVESVTSSEDKQLGYYFCKPDEGNNIITAKRFVSKVLFYLWNDVFKNYGFDAMLDGKKVFAYKNDAGEDTTMAFTSFFEKDGNPNLKQVGTLMENLSIQAETVIPSHATTAHIAKSARNYDKFVINDGPEEYPKRRIATEAVRQYIKNKGTITAKEVADAWNDLEIGIPNFVMTQGEHNELKSATAKNRCNKVEWNGEVVYVTTHLWGDDYGYINKLIEEVNKTDWGITIERRQKG